MNCCEQDGRVHVYGLPDEGCALEEDEQLCSDRREDGCVVYHVAAVQVQDGEWACACCGESSFSGWIPYLQ